MSELNDQVTFEVQASTTLSVPVDATLEDGVYTAVAVTESLKPISLLLQ